MSDAGRGERDRLEREFVAEAEEILDRAAAGVGRIQEASGAGLAIAPAVNALFRDIHALKGLASSLGFQEVADLAHALEDLLDRLRRGRAAWDEAGRDLVEETLETLLRLARERRRVGAGRPDTAALRRRLAARPMDPVAAPPADPVAAPGGAGPLLDPVLAASLSGYEEERLRRCLEAGDTVHLVRADLDPAGFDAQARAIAADLAGRGEVLAMLPAPDGAAAAPGRLRFLFLVVSKGPLETPAEIAAAPLRVLPVGPPPAGPGAGPAAPVAETPAPAAAGGTAASDDGGDAGSPDPPLLSGSVRVPVERLDDLVGQVGELSVAAAALIEAAGRARESRPRDPVVGAVDRAARALLPRLRTLRRATVQVRLVPLEQVFVRLARLVARGARAAGKEADLHTLGGETEIDRAVMDELAAPLRHLLLNGLDHGVEPPAERRRAGKPARGRLVLSAFQRAGRVIIDVIDDGRGIDLARVRAAAEAAGHAAPGAPLSDQQIGALIFLPGVSTAERVSAVSGRGVGLDAVRGAIRRLKGAVAVRTVAGRGTTFTMTVPISLALVQALLVRAGGQRYAIPLASIRDSFRISAARLRAAPGVREAYDLPGGPLPLCRIERLVSPAAPGAGSGEGYAVVAEAGGRRLGLVVDELIGRREIVVKPLGGRLRDLAGVAGAAEMGDATAVLVLDPEGLMGGQTDAGAA
jgi:two-component system chemotaxis sensor kinase CheA